MALLKTHMVTNDTVYLGHEHQQLLAVLFYDCPFAELIFCQHYFLFNFTKRTLVSNRPKNREKKLLTTCVPVPHTLQTECQAPHTRHQSHSLRSAVPRDRLLCIQHTNLLDCDHMHLSLFLKSPHCCQWHLSIIITNPAIPNNSV